MEANHKEMNPDKEVGERIGDDDEEDDDLLEMDHAYLEDAVEDKVTGIQDVENVACKGN